MNPKIFVKTSFVIFLACILIHYILEFLLKHFVVFIITFVIIVTYSKKNQ